MGYAMIVHEFVIGHDKKVQLCSDIWGREGVLPAFEGSTAWKKISDFRISGARGSNFGSSPSASGAISSTCD